MIKIEQREFVFPQPLKQSTKNIAEFVFQGDKNNIELLQASCGCTVGTTQDNKIIVTYSAPNRQTSVAQKVTVWLRDGVELDVINPVNGQKIKNQTKAHIDLWIKGTVE